MRKIYHLSTCNTCKRVIEELGGLPGFVFQNVREKNIEPATLDTLAKKAGSYEALFNRRAVKYKQLGLNTRKLTEKDYRKYILSEYTFLKRPVIIIDREVFVGNSKEEITRAKKYLSQ